MSLPDSTEYWWGTQPADPKPRTRLRHWCPSDDGATACGGSLRKSKMVPNRVGGARAADKLAVTCAVCKAAIKEGK